MVLECFLVPLVLLITADLVSLTRSGDLELSVYGVIEHFRAALLFVVVALSLRQGKSERRAASLAIVWAVITIGASVWSKCFSRAHLGDSCLELVN